MIFHTVDIFDKPTQRHFFARDTWEPLYNAGEVKPVNPDNYQRSAKSVMGDPRNLPFLKDLLKTGLQAASGNNDIILWCNDDIQLDPRIVEWCQTKIKTRGAMSMRRIEPRTSWTHVGRDLFAFRADWLEEKWDKIPDFVLGCPAFDIVLAAIIRREKGIDSTLDNMSQDIQPCDAVERYAIHEAHIPNWSGPNEFRFPANSYNRRLAKEWCHFNMPGLKL